MITLDDFLSPCLVAPRASQHGGLYEQITHAALSSMPRPMKIIMEKQALHQRQRINEYNMSY